MTKLEFISSPIVLPKKANFNSKPICIGGIGGSGTRVVAEILEQMGFFIGKNTNISKDNFDIPLNKVLDHVADPAQALEMVNDILENFELKMSRGSYSETWAWKVPGSFYWLDFLCSYFSELRYIHVIRNGFDMAYSPNVNQIRNWGPLFGFNISSEATPQQMLEFWIVANNFATEKCTRLLKGRFHIVKFDDLCSQPMTEVKKIADFLQQDLSDKKLKEIGSIVKPPDSLDRYKKVNSRARFERHHVKSVNHLGFYL